MRRNAENAVRRPLCVLMTAGAVLTMLTAGRAVAQTQSTDPKPAEGYATLYLTNLTEAREANDAVTDLRNMLPKAKIYRVESANAISIYATAEDIAKAQKILADIDRPRKTYRLTYTITDGSAQGGARHFVMIASVGNKTMLKQGTKVPIITGTNGTGSEQNTQVQYMDIGMNLDATLEGHGDEMRLHTKFEESSVAEEKSNVGIQDPVIHQAVLEGESAIVMGKPEVLGSVDMPGSGKRVELSVVAEAVK
jgi:type II secretory pathway component GspD/PulD (secretin)